MRPFLLAVVAIRLAAQIPLSDLGLGTYQGLPGGLYEFSQNLPPTDHRDAGLLAAASVTPVDGKIVLLSVGMSNTSLEFCNELTLPCTPESFIGQMSAASGNPAVVAVNGAQGGKGVENWTAGASVYNTVNSRIKKAGLAVSQVRAVWVKQALETPACISLPALGNDSDLLAVKLATLIRRLKVEYPNLKQVFVSSRIYAYTTGCERGEPLNYETGFAVKKVIQSQINQARGGAVDPLLGDLSYAPGPAVWTAWGPYLWANGITPRSDGLTWQPSDFKAGGVHPLPAGVQKVASRLLGFFLMSEYTTWIQ